MTDTRISYSRLIMATLLWLWPVVKWTLILLVALTVVGGIYLGDVLLAHWAFVGNAASYNNNSGGAWSSALAFLAIEALINLLLAMNWNNITNSYRKHVLTAATVPTRIARTRQKIADHEQEIARLDAELTKLGARNEKNS